MKASVHINEHSQIFNLQCEFPLVVPNVLSNMSCRVHAVIHDLQKNSSCIRMQGSPVLCIIDISNLERKIRLEIDLPAFNCDIAQGKLTSFPETLIRHCTVHAGLDQSLLSTSLPISALHVPYFVSLCMAPDADVLYT